VPTRGRGGGGRRSLASIRERIASRIWPVPAAAIVLAVALGVLVPELDRRVDDGLGPGLSDLLFGGGADAAREVLSTIAGSLISATTLTFSLTVVALQLASSQATPRVLRMFARDPVVHATMAVFLGTFAYAFTVLRTVRSADEGEPFVPAIAVTLASLLTVASVITLVLFLAHLATRLRVETMMRDVHSETSSSFRRSLDTGQEERGHDRPRVPDARTLVLSERSGFVTAIDRPTLVAEAARQGVVVRELHAVGESVVRGTPLAEWWPSEDAGARRADADAVEHAIVRAHGIEYERTATQDVAFGIRQLVDIASRALSPGVNDPTTAVHVLSHLSALLCDLLAAEPPGAVLLDDDGRARIIARVPSGADLLDQALEQMRRYGATTGDVAARMLQLLREVAWVARPEYRADVRDQADRLMVALDAAGYDRVERERLRRLRGLVDDALDGRWPATIT